MQKFSQSAMYTWNNGICFRRVCNFLLLKMSDEIQIRSFMWLPASKEGRKIWSNSGTKKLKKNFSKLASMAGQRGRKSPLTTLITKYCYPWAEVFQFYPFDLKIFLFNMLTWGMSWKILGLRVCHFRSISQEACCLHIWLKTAVNQSVDFRN